MSSDDLQKLRDAHHAIRRDLRRLVGNELVFDDAKAELAKLRESLTHLKGSRYAPLVGAITGLAVVGIGYGVGRLATEAAQRKSDAKWTEKVQQRAGTVARTL